MSDCKHPIRIRPHHFMCMHGFQGEGYNDLFVSRLRDIIDRLHHDHDQIVDIVSAADDICLYCPHAKAGGVCDHDTKVSVYDEKVRDFFKMQEGYTPFNEIEETVNAHLSAEVLNRICADCQWIDLCLKSFKEEV